jgi:transposase
MWMLVSRGAEQLEFFAGSLRDLIPDEHVLARVARVLDLSWLRAEVAELYCADNGRPGIDPEAAVRLMLAGFLLGIVHDRKLMREAHVNVAIRWFAGFGLAERLPDHSSLTRIRQRWGETRFRRIFERTVAACIVAKIAKGEIVHIDATLIREGGTALKQQAVLFRASHHSGPLEVELTRRNIPFVKFGGLKFLDSAHVKDLLAMLRFAQNPRDRVAGFRLMLLLPGVGPASAQRAQDSMAARTDPLAALAEMPAPPRSGEHWAGFLATLRELHSGRAGWPAEIELARRWYEPHLERAHEDASMRHADLLQLEQIAAGYPSRERFLTELTLDPPGATSDQSGVPHLDEDYLILSTIHSAKGQEWKSVFVLNVVDGCIPSDLGTGTTAEIEEERRLLYVAMTRAKDSLHCVLPQRFFVHGQSPLGDRHVYASRTRFIPPSLLGLFESRTWPPATAASERANALQIRVDVGARMRGMWR